ncbi:MAG TPA: flavin reductase family protein [Feifaniaceae bacterium]|nr:flavin reductase family protein [Feifaniaceae bacterium]
MDPAVLFKLSYGLYVIGVMDGDTPQGCVVNTVFQVTAEGMLAVSMSKNNYTHRLMQDTGRFSVSILTEATPPRTIGRFGYSSGADVKKFDGLDFTLRGGLPMLKAECAGYLFCEIVGSHDAGTHTVFFANVYDGCMDEACAIKGFPVMTYDYYHKVIKAKAPKNAPTYQAAAK